MAIVSGGVTASSGKQVYWIEPLVNIVTGERALEREEFAEDIVILCRHRINKDMFPSDEVKDAALLELYEVYAALKDERELSVRVALLATDYMKALADCSACTLNAEQRTYVTTTSIPRDLDAGVAGSSKLLENETFRTWVTNYRFACTTPEMVVPQMDLFSGMSDEIKLPLIERIKATTMKWYVQYQSKEVTKADAEVLLHKIKSFVENKPVEGEPLANPIMEEAFQSYLEIGKDFPLDKVDAYWIVRINNLQICVNNLA